MWKFLGGLLCGVIVGIVLVLLLLGFIDSTYQVYQLTGDVDLDTVCPFGVGECNARGVLMAGTQYIATLQKGNALYIELYTVVDASKMEQVAVLKETAE